MASGGRMCVRALMLGSWAGARRMMSTDEAGMPCSSSLEQAPHELLTSLSR